MLLCSLIIRRCQGGPVLFEYRGNKVVVLRLRNSDGRFCSVSKDAKGLSDINPTIG